MEIADAAKRTLEERIRSLEFENRQYDPRFFTSQEGNTEDGSSREREREKERERERDLLIDSFLFLESFVL